MDRPQLSAQARIHASPFSPTGSSCHRVSLGCHLGFSSQGAGRGKWFCQVCDVLVRLYTVSCDWLVLMRFFTTNSITYGFHHHSYSMSLPDVGIANVNAPPPHLWLPSPFLLHVPSRCWYCKYQCLPPCSGQIPPNCPSLSPTSKSRLGKLSRLRKLRGLNRQGWY